MLNIFGALGQVARLLPNYVEGQRQAVQDNWRDLQQYNQTQLGQLQNMFAERTLPWRINMAGDEAAQSRMMTQMNMLAGLEYLAGGAGRLTTALMGNQLNPQLFARNAQNLLSGYGDNNAYAGFLQQIVQPFAQQGQMMQQPQQQQPMPGATDTAQRMNNQTQNPTAAQ